MHQSASFHPRLSGVLTLCLAFAACANILAENPQATPSDAASTRARLHKPLPETLTSFGAAVLGDYLYVFSGHSGDAHGEGRDLLVDHFRRIKVDDPQAAWEELAQHEPAQSTALITDGKYLYRIGGLTFLNRSGEETNFKSTQHFSRYDVQQDKWEELAPLPEPRSSLDAAILGRTIYVAGGWNLQGESSRDADWHEDILKFDLDNPSAGWQSIPGPGYKSRAIALAAHKGKIYLLGGIQDRGISRKVSIYDPQTNSWSEGPEMQADSATAGFASSAFEVDGQLYYTGGSGIVYRLNDEKHAWEVADRLLFPRMFLRLLPLKADRLIALGGTSMGAGRIGVVESLQMDPSFGQTPKQVSWNIKFNGKVRQSQCLVLDGMQLYAFGGNKSQNPHDFKPSAFSKEAFVFDLSRQTVEQLPDLPLALQSGTALVLSQTSEHNSILVSGGMGFQDDQFTALKTLFRFDPEAKKWSRYPVELPQPRSMFSAVTQDEAVWFFAGSTVGKERSLLTTIDHWWGDDSAPAALPGIKLPTPRRSAGGALLKDEYYLAGGLTAESGLAETVDVFHFQDRTWRTAPAPQVPRVFPSLVATGNKLYLYGGFTRADGHFQPATSLEMYDPQTEKWKTIAESIPGVSPTMSMFPFNGRLLFYGIDPQVAGQANFVLYDPAPLTAPEQVASMSFGGRRRDPAGQARREALILMRKDTDKDGKLSAAELGSRMKNFFHKADQNQDQTLTLEELTTVIQQDQRENAPQRPRRSRESASDKADQKPNAKKSSETENKQEK